MPTQPSKCPGLFDKACLTAPSSYVHQANPKPATNNGMQVRKMSFDPMAAAVDWLDAYHAGESMRLYADDAVIHCACEGMKTITGKEGMRAWVQRIREYPRPIWTTSIRQIVEQ
ncbi:nuclear transport factor 2 family protein [Bradyrhizobium sp. CB1650]|uniref:nuclear transport factor 2 family protein n=1 Tax=Bradyrhizobium sp. CB1650 TaxID=3039153 RepID=UPI0024357756|nr:nuclear transport factor 2 family protein [Bradyrhizobium sp. CB1650]WGD54948.1 nuclear transport factor 2 family protein [Bradyrhizobium sp. CB1650]